MFGWIAIDQSPVSIAVFALVFGVGLEHFFAPEDVPEIAVARRLYRTGDSEYLLNNGVSRLRDDLSADSLAAGPDERPLLYAQLERTLRDLLADRGDGHLPLGVDAEVREREQVGDVAGGGRAASLRGKLIDGLQVVLDRARERLVESRRYQSV